MYFPFFTLILDNETGQVGTNMGKHVHACLCRPDIALPVLLFGSHEEHAAYYHRRKDEALTALEQQVSLSRTWLRFAHIRKPPPTGHPNDIGGQKVRNDFPKSLFGLFLTSTGYFNIFRVVWSNLIKCTVKQGKYCGKQSEIVDPNLSSLSVSLMTRSDDVVVLLSYCITAGIHHGTNPQRSQTFAHRMVGTEEPKFEWKGPGKLRHVQNTIEGDGRSQARGGRGTASLDCTGAFFEEDCWTVGPHIRM